jgi:hypothetical protein
MKAVPSPETLTKSYKDTRYYFHEDDTLHATSQYVITQRGNGIRKDEIYQTLIKEIKIVLKQYCSIPRPSRFRNFSSPRRPDRLWGSLSLLSDGYRGLFPEVKRPARETDSLPQTSADVKKT